VRGYEQDACLVASVRDYALVLGGALLEAVALRLFLVPANLASGGISGISQLITHYTGWPIGLMVFIGNLPLFLLGWRYLVDGASCCVR